MQVFFHILGVFPDVTDVEDLAVDGFEVQVGVLHDRMDDVKVGHDGASQGETLPHGRHLFRRVGESVQTRFVHPRIQRGGQGRIHGYDDVELLGLLIQFLDGLGGLHCDHPLFGRYGVSCTAYAVLSDGAWSQSDKRGRMLLPRNVSRKDPDTGQGHAIPVFCGMSSGFDIINIYPDIGF